MWDKQVALKLRMFWFTLKWLVLCMHFIYSSLNLI